MKSIKKDDLDKIKNALILIYQKKDEKKISDQWHRKVMEHIISMGSPCIDAGYFAVFQQFVWKLVPVTCILVMILGLIISRIDFFTSYELSKIFVNDPSDFILLTLLNK